MENATINFITRNPNPNEINWCTKGSARSVDMKNVQLRVSDEPDQRGRSVVSIKFRYGAAKRLCDACGFNLDDDDVYMCFGIDNESRRIYFNRFNRYDGFKFLVYNRSKVDRYFQMSVPNPEEFRNMVGDYKLHYDTNLKLCFIEY